MKLRKIVETMPVATQPGDTINLKYTDAQGVETVVLTDEITEAAVYDHAAIFDVDSTGIVGFSGIGGAFLHKNGDEPPTRQGSGAETVPE